MSHYRRAFVPGGTFFFTVVTYRRQSWLVEPDARAALRDAIERCRAARPFIVDAWVLMPDHLHAVWTLPPNDADYSTRWAQIKRTVSVLLADRKRADWVNDSKRTHRESTLWQRRFRSVCGLRPFEPGETWPRGSRCRLAVVNVSPVREIGRVSRRLDGGHARRRRRIVGWAPCAHADEPSLRIQPIVRSKHRTRGHGVPTLRHYALKPSQNKALHKALRQSPPAKSCSAQSRDRP